MTNLYKDLATLQAKRKELEAKESLVKLAILEQMEKEGAETITNTYGKFTVSHRTSYTYTDAVAKLAEKVKLAQIKEVEKGIAKPKVTTYLTVTTK